MSETADRESIRAQIEGLDLGETYSRARRFDGDYVTKDQIAEAQKAIRLSMQTTVHRVEGRTGNRYTIEVGEFLTYSKDRMIVVCATRME